MRTPTRLARQISLTSSTISSKSLLRFSIGPPYWSLRRLVSELRNWSSTGSFGDLSTKHRPRKNRLFDVHETHETPRPFPGLSSNAMR